MNKILAPLFLALSASAYASAPFHISEPKVSGDCSEDSEIRVVEDEKGEYYIKAFFNQSMMAEGKGGFQKRRCTLDFKLSVDRDFQLDVFDFAVDGVYNLSETGIARLTVSHRVGNAPSVRQTAFFSRSEGSPSAGDISNFVGSIFGYQLQSYGSCGASRIPLETSVYATALQEDGDTGLTYIDLDEGVSSAQGYTICKVKVKPCY